MLRRILSNAAGLLATTALLLLPAGCIEESESEARVSYDKAAVRNADGETLAGSTQPGGVYAAYQEPPGFPLTISTTAALETRNGGGGDGTAESDDGTESGGWTRTDLRDGTVTVLGDSICTKRSVECGSRDCSVALEVAGDGYCVVSLSLAGASGERARDCWGYGWVDGRNQTPDERDEKHQKLIEKRDELCSD